MRDKKQLQPSLREKEVLKLWSEAVEDISKRIEKSEPLLQNYFDLIEQGAKKTEIQKALGKYQTRAKRIFAKVERYQRNLPDVRYLPVAFKAHGKKRTEFPLPLRMGLAKVLLRNGGEGALDAEKSKRILNHSDSDLANLYEQFSYKTLRKKPSKKELEKKRRARNNGLTFQEIHRESQKKYAEHMARRG